MLVTRPWHSAVTLGEQLKARGHDPLLFPLLKITSVGDLSVPPRDIAALLFTSANAPRVLAVCWPESGIPVFTVGAATAHAAREVGYANIRVAGGDGPALLDLVRQTFPPEAGPLLHIRGQDIATPVASTLAHDGYHVREQVIYRAERVDAIPDEVARPIGQGRIGAALFYSARTASAFVSLLPVEMRPGLVCTRALAIAEPVAQKLGELEFKSVEISGKPDTEALLELLDRRPDPLCT